MAAESRILRLTFLTSQGRRSSLSIRDPIEEPEAADIQTLMEKIIAEDVFDTNSGSLAEKVEAVMVTTATEVISDFAGE